MGDIEIGTGGPDDVPAVLAMLDGATQWLAAQGRVGQWGTEPQSTSPRRIDSVTSFARASGLHLACVDGNPVGVLARRHALRTGEPLRPDA